MKAVQIVAPGDVQLVEVPVPEPGDNEVLVKVHACVTCPQWDITMMRGIDIFERPGWPKYPAPVGWPGHEMSGDVTSVGKSVTTLKVGDRVAALQTTGQTVPGYYADYAVLPETYLVKIADAVSYETAASMEMARYVASYVRQVDYQGRRTGIVGLGPAGLISLQMAKALGASEVVGVDLLTERLELAEKLGATEVIDSSSDAGMVALAANSFEACVDCSGVAPGTQLAFDNTHGPLAIFGVIHGEVMFTRKHWSQKLTIAPRPGPSEADTQFVLDLWNKGQLDTESLISARLPFSRYADGIQMLMDRKAIRICYGPE